MIITRLTNGLGNQMFQYAAGLALAEQHRTVQKLDIGWFRHDPEQEPHNRYALSCFNITEQFAAKQEVDYLQSKALTTVERWSASIARRLRFYNATDRLRLQGNYYSEKTDFGRSFWQKQDNTYLRGFWQSERFFLPIANLLRIHFSFRYPPQPWVAEFIAKIGSGPSAFVHFRRGDYATNRSYSRHIGVLPIDYYHRAVEVVRAHCPNVRLYVFSDDIASVRREFHPGGSHVFVDIVEHWHAYDMIRLMSACDHAVISNSTFAWWAAWLNPSPNKFVLAPDPWFASSLSKIRELGRDVVPDSWIRLPVRPFDYETQDQRCRMALSQNSKSVMEPREGG